jgi:hypothetical protein
MTENAPTAPDTVVLVHGFWVTPRSWLEVEALREDPSPIEALSVPAIAGRYEEVMGELDSPPSSGTRRGV